MISTTQFVNPAIYLFSPVNRRYNLSVTTTFHFPPDRFMSTWVLSLTDETESPALFLATPPAAPTTLPVASLPAVALGSGRS
jgi:hypothetical protein